MLISYKRLIFSVLKLCTRSEVYIICDPRVGTTTTVKSNFTNRFVGDSSDHRVVPSVKRFFFSNLSWLLSSCYGVLIGRRDGKGNCLFDRVTCW